MLDNSNRIPHTVISKAFVAELIRDLCYFAADLGPTVDGHPQRQRRPCQCPATLCERMALLHELCDSEDQLTPFLVAEFGPVFRSVIAAFASRFNSAASPPSDRQMVPPPGDQLLCHFLPVVSSLITFDFASFFQVSVDIDHFLSLCFAALCRTECAHSMAISLTCLVRFLFSARRSSPPLAASAAVRLVAHCSAANFTPLAAFVLHNSLSAALLRSIWQFLHAMSADEMTAVALSDLVPSLAALISADPSVLSHKFPRAPNGDEEEEKPLALLTLSNLLHKLPSDSADTGQLAALLREEIGNGTQMDGAER